MSSPVQISTTPVPSGESPSFHGPGKPPTIAVIIDVLRATTVITTAIAAGCRELQTYRRIEHVRRAAEMYQRLHPRSAAMLTGGERHCLPVEKFDFGNSPAQYNSNVSGRTIAMTTTNGTVAIQWANAAAEMILASFLNFSAVVQTLATYEKIHLVCAGTDGDVTLEDIALAAFLIGGIIRLTADAVELDDSSRAAIETIGNLGLDPIASPPTAEQCRMIFQKSVGGANLIAAGLSKDLDDCAAVDSLTTVGWRTCRQPPTFVAEADYKPPVHSDG